ncbi:3-keto-disaccharide hydrolase [Alteromonas sp. S167]|uniref:3-keto-disaccharide hydrolase n=1 Tax=Alteromonas sp. S167 TaxID=3117402 RepID=UPI003F68AD59
MNKISVAKAFVLFSPIMLVATNVHSSDNGRLTREQQAAKTEVWEPVPNVVSFSANNVPSDATLLLGKDLSGWESLEGGNVVWSMKDGVLTVKPGAGDIKTKASFCDIQLHVEWMAPQPEEGMEGQQRNNSGIFLQQRYEVQVLDSFENKTYPNGQAASVYKQTIPLVNAMKAPDSWQTYDIIYKAPRFDGDALMSPGYVTVLHNGVVVQNHTEIQGTTEWIGAPQYKAHGCAPLQLQDHGNYVSFRNIWVREL